MKLGSSSRKESWTGVIFTLVICLGFLYWLFRPKENPWQHEDPAGLVARALKEPRSSNRVESQVIDLDLMEVAICQVGVKFVDDALASVKGIVDPVIRKRAIRQVVQTYLNSDPQDLARVITFADLPADPADQAALRAEILGSLAVLGFADIALPEAKTALQKATLARRMATTDDAARDKARGMVSEATKELASLPPAVADAVRAEIAGALVGLSLTDGPAAALEAIDRLPAPARPELWMELTDWCLSRPDSRECMTAIMARIPDPVLRRRLEINSLGMRVKVRPPVEVIADCKADVEAAPSPTAKVAALILLSDARRNAQESTGLSPEADAALKEALTTARAMTNPLERCRALITLTRKFTDPPLLEEAKPILEQAINDANLIESPADRIAALVLASEESFMQSDEPLASKLIGDAVGLAEASGTPLDAATVESLAIAVLWRGNWPRGLALLDHIPEGSRAAALDRATNRVAETSVSMDPRRPPLRGAPVDEIRRQAAGDDAKAIALVEKQPEGYARARAFLAMAKGLIGPPAELPGQETGGTDSSGK